MVIRVSKGEGVTGVVVNQHELRVGHVMVRLTPTKRPAWCAGDESSSIAQVSDDGSFSFDGLLPGTYEIVVGENQCWRFPPPQQRHLVKAGDNDLRVCVEEAVAVRLRLIDKATQVLIQSPISWRKYAPSGGIEMSGGSNTGKDGVIVYGKQGSQLAIEVDAEGYRPAGILRILVRPDGLEQDVRVECDHDPEAYAHVELVVSDSSGAAVEMLSIYREAIRDEKRTRNGRYMLRLPPGEHELILETPREDFYNLEPSWLPQSIQVSVGRGQKMVRRVVMRRGGWIRVWTNRLLEESALLVVDGEHQVDTSFHKDRSSAGYACLVPPGSYSVRASLNAGGKKETAQATVTVTAGSVADVELRFGG
jgi:hypothetical protein